VVRLLRKAASCGLRKGNFPRVQDWYSFADISWRDFSVGEVGTWDKNCVQKVVWEIEEACSAWVVQSQSLIARNCCRM